MNIKTRRIITAIIHGILLFCILQTDSTVLETIFTSLMIVNFAFCMIKIME